MISTEYANNIFEQPWWLDMVAPGCWKELLVRDTSNNVIARQVVVYKKMRIYMPHHTQTLGIWVADSEKGDYGAQKRIIQELNDQIKSYKRVWMNLAPENDYVLPYRWLGYSIEPLFTYRIDDLTNLDRLYQGFNKTAKKNIKSAKNKVAISYETDVSELWDMLNKTFEAQNRRNPMRRDLIEKIVTQCDKNNSGKYISAKDNEGNVHSCAYFVYDGNVCYYLFGATDPEFRSSGAQSLVLWEGIQFASKHSKSFDFEGSMIEGIENFFRQFNSKCVVYYGIRKNSFFDNVFGLIKPKIKRMLGYKI